MPVAPQIEITPEGVSATLARAPPSADHELRFMIGAILEWDGGTQMTQRGRLLSAEGEGFSAEEKGS